MKYLSVFIMAICLILHGINATGQKLDVSKEVIGAIKAMDAKKMATHFGTSLDLEISGISGTYSKTQAEGIMRDFFKKSPAKTFTVNHEGSSNDGSEFIIGTYLTSSKSYRVYVLMKKESEQLLIRQLQIEEE
ncbi:MAG: DUF4783 domain-containing protein [Bacteroidetes bacterium]|nr:DUF4783 domain-containing protein [Bacteroidota bacterium]